MRRLRTGTSAIGVLAIEVERNRKMDKIIGFSWKRFGQPGAHPLRTRGICPVVTAVQAGCRTGVPSRSEFFGSSGQRDV
jgi:hypothetical protein